LGLGDEMAMATVVRGYPIVLSQLARNCDGTEFLPYASMDRPVHLSGTKQREK
jgi:hypothetical protein